MKLLSQLSACLPGLPFQGRLNAPDSRLPPLNAPVSRLPLSMHLSPGFPLFMRLSPGFPLSCAFLSLKGCNHDLRPSRGAIEEPVPPLNLPSLANSCPSRDVKPNNCLISATGELKLGDFGLSRILASPERGRPYTNEVEGGSKWMYILLQYRCTFTAISMQNDLSSLCCTLGFCPMVQISGASIRRIHVRLRPGRVGSRLHICRSVEPGAWRTTTSALSQAQRTNQVQLIETLSLLAPTRLSVVTASQALVPPTDA